MKNFSKFEKIKRFFKNKKGNFVTAIIVFPMWLFVILMMSVEINNHYTMKKVTEDNYNISRIIQMASSYQDAKTSVNNYITKVNGSVQHYEATADDCIFEVISITKDGDYTEKIDNPDISTTMKDYWKPKNIVQYKITIYTANKLNNNLQFTFMGRTWNVVDQSFTIVSNVMILGGVA